MPSSILRTLVLVRMYEGGMHFQHSGFRRRPSQTRFCVVAVDIHGIGQLDFWVIHQDFWIFLVINKSEVTAASKQPQRSELTSYLKSKAQQCLFGLFWPNGKKKEDKLPLLELSASPQLRIIFLWVLGEISMFLHEMELCSCSTRLRLRQRPRRCQGYDEEDDRAINGKHCHLEHFPQIPCKN